MSVRRRSARLATLYIESDEQAEIVTPGNGRKRRQPPTSPKNSSPATPVITNADNLFRRHVEYEEKPRQLLILVVLLAWLAYFAFNRNALVVLKFPSPQVLHARMTVSRGVRDHITHVFASRMPSRKLQPTLKQTYLAPPKGIEDILVTLQSHGWARHLLNDANT